MNKQLKLFTFLLILTALTISVMAIEPQYFYKQGETVDNIFQCTLDTGQYCGITFQCNLTLTSPNTTVLINNQPYDNNINFYNYTLEPTILSLAGDYKADVCCTNNSNGECSSFYIRVNNSGQEDNILLNLGVIAALIAVVFGYLYSTFNIDEEKFFTKIVLLFAAIADMCGLLLLGMATQTDRFSFLAITEIVFIVNILILIMLLFSYIWYVIKNYFGRIEKAAYGDDNK